MRNETHDLTPDIELKFVGASIWSAGVVDEGEFNVGELLAVTHFT